MAAICTHTQLSSSHPSSIKHTDPACANDAAVWAHYSRQPPPISNGVWPRSVQPLNLSVSVGHAWIEPTLKHCALLWGCHFTNYARRCIMVSLRSLARVGGAVLCVGTVSATVVALQRQRRKHAEKEGHSEDGKALMAVMRDLMDNRKLLVVPPDHWLMGTLNQAKRLEHEVMLKSERDSNPDSAPEELKISCLQALLTELKPELLSSKADVAALSDRVTVIASLFSELLPEFPPLLVEVAVMHCLQEWSRGRREPDVEAFEEFLLAELRGDRASSWFDSQIMIDSVQLLLLSRLFYSERIQDPLLQSVLSMCELRGNGDIKAFTRMLMACFSMNEFTPAATAWAKWLESEVEKINLSQPPKSRSRSTGLGELMATTELFDPSKRVYFPQGMLAKGISGKSFGDLSGTLRYSKHESDALFPGIFYVPDNEQESPLLSA